MPYQNMYLSNFDTSITIFNVVNLAFTTGQGFSAGNGNKCEKLSSYIIPRCFKLHQ